jgi:hypothetical protein
MPLTLRAAWQQRGISIDFPSIWPLRVEVAYIESDRDGNEGHSGSPDGGGGGEGGADKSSKGATSGGKDAGTAGSEDSFDSSNALSATVGAEADAQRRLRLYVLLWTPFIAIQDIWLQYYIGCVAAAAAAAASAVANQSSSSLHFPPPPLPSLSLLGAPRFPRLAVTSR